MFSFRQNIYREAVISEKTFDFAQSTLSALPRFAFCQPFVIHKLIAFILGLGCKIVALSCEDVICFLLALESVV